jgi:hypothetical protein
MKRTLHRELRADLIGHVDQALDHVRKVIDVVPDCGPLLVESYRCLSALRKLLDVVDSLPEVGRDADA